GLVAHGRDLEPAEGAGVQTVLVELLAHGLDRVDTRERNPFVAPLDESTDRLVHLLRIAWRFDRDRGHFLRHRAVASQARGEALGLLLGAGHQDSPAVERLRLEPR